MKKSVQGKCVSLGTLKKYKKGSLSGSKKATVEAHLSTCDLCAYTASSLETINEQELEEDLTILKKNISQKLFDSKKQKRSSVGLYRIAAALAFLLTVGFAIRFFTAPAASSDLYGQYYQAYEIPDALMRSTQENSPTISPALASAIANYTKTPYQKSDIPTSFENNPHQTALANLLNGLSALEKNNPQAAIPLLEKVEATKTKYAEDASWYLALAHLKLDNSSKSVNYLDKILLLGDGFYLEKATALKAQLLN